MALECPAPPDTRDSVDADHPGMRFQTYILENYHCPVVWPLCSSSSPSLFWISQTNGKNSSPSSTVAKGLNYHFCFPPESFSVSPVLPFVFTSSAASVSVRNHLVKIGVFAIEGLIFRIHADRQMAVADVLATSPLRQAGQVSNFKPDLGHSAQLVRSHSDRPSHLPERPAHLTVSAHAPQLVSSTEKASTCPAGGDHQINSAVKSHFSAPHLTAALNAPPPPHISAAAPDHRLASLTNDGDNRACSSRFTTSGIHPG